MNALRFVGSACAAAGLVTGILDDKPAAAVVGGLLLAWWIWVGPYKA